MGNSKSKLKDRIKNAINSSRLTKTGDEYDLPVRAKMTRSDLEDTNKNLKKYGLYAKKRKSQRSREGTEIEIYSLKNFCNAINIIIIIALIILLYIAITNKS